MTTLTSKTTFWSENKLILKECCCCSRDGCVKDIGTEYYDTGVREMYSEMIFDTFNIDLRKSSTTLKQYICDPCIVKLKNAFVFKWNIQKNHEALVAKVNNLNNQMKEDIKCEVNEFQDDSYEDGISEEVLNDDAKNSSTLKILEKSEETKTRAKYETKPKEHQKKDGIDNKQKTSKNVKSTILRKDSLKLISNSSIWVFNWSQGRFRCFCCKEPFSDINLLKKHTETHKIEEIETKIQISENNLVKVEVSDIFCLICEQKFLNLPSLVDHFKIHDIIITGHILVPIKINELTCQICQEKFNNFYFLYRHMISHYENCICDKCGSGFHQKRHLKQHIRKFHNPNQNNIVKRFHNPNQNKIVKRNQLKCYYCLERFKQFHLRVKHMVEKHDLKEPEFPCHLCNKIYLTKGILNAHIKNSHNIKDFIYECDICFKKFRQKNCLARHKDIHTEGLNYFCSICNHGFKLKTSLGRHMKRKHRN